jgi:vacuolar-type H+-ATPase subunit I/STV1
MIPVIIEDYISKLKDSKTRIENRQFYYTSLLEIKKQVEKALSEYEEEKKKDNYRVVFHNKRKESR